MGSQKILLNPAEVNFGEIENGNIYSIQLQVQNVHKSSIQGLVLDLSLTARAFYLFILLKNY